MNMSETEGELKKRIQKIEKNKFQFPVVDNRLKVVVQDMINMNREHDVVAMLAILDEAKQEFWQIKENHKNDGYDGDREIMAFYNFGKKWFGNKEVNV